MQTDQSSSHTISTITLAVLRMPNIQSRIGTDELRTIVRVNDRFRVEDITDMHWIFATFQVSDNI
jgi:hypothetical protein